MSICFKSVKIVIHNADDRTKNKGYSGRLVSHRLTKLNAHAIYRINCRMEKEEEFNLLWIRNSAIWYKT
jgi:hypothetical protein